MVADPEIKVFKFHSQQDFIVLGCDGVFDNVNNEEAIDFIWKKIRNQSCSLTKSCSLAVESLINLAVAKQSTDNVTVVVVALQDTLGDRNQN